MKSDNSGEVDLATSFVDFHRETAGVHHHHPKTYQDPLIDVEEEIISKSAYPAIIVMVIATTMITPHW
jgi:hypothetical protein